MVQKGEAKLLCDEECETFKAKQKKLLSEEDEMRKKGELKAQQVTWTQLSSFRTLQTSNVNSLFYPQGYVGREIILNTSS